MKTSELRDKTEQELTELETELRHRLLKLQVARATNLSEFPRIRRDIARIKTILHERATGIERSGGATQGS
jgi:large subunit ribosomal protein L29